MRSLLSNYFSRLKTIEDSTSDAEFSDEEDILKFKKISNDSSSTKNIHEITENMNKKLEELRMLKFIDDSDSLDSASNLMNEASGYYENDYGYGNNSGRKSNQFTQTTSEQRNEACSGCYNSTDTPNIQQLILGQSESNREGKIIFKLNIFIHTFLLLNSLMF